MPLLKERKNPVSYAQVIFHGRGKPYTYKTIINLHNGDKVIVEANGRITLAEVFNNKCSNPKFKCSWILKKLNLEQIKKDHYKKLESLGIE